MLFRDFCFLFSQRDRVKFILLNVMLVCCSFIEMATLGAVPLFVAALLGQEDALRVVSRLPFRGEIGANGIEGLAVYGGLLLALLFLLRTLYFMLCANLQERLLRNRMIAVTSRLFKAYMFAPYIVARSWNSSAITEQACTECDLLIYHLLDPAFNFIRNTIISLSVLLLLVWFDPLASLTSFFVLGIIGCVFMLFSSRRVKRLGKTTSDFRAAAVKIMVDAIGIRREATLSAVRGHFTGRYHAALERQTEPQRISNTIQRCVWPSMELITVVVLIGTMCIMLASGRKIGDVAPTLSLLAVSLARLKGCVTELMIHFSRIRFHSAILEKIASEIRFFEEASGDETAAEKVSAKLPLNERISVRNLTFKYPDADTPVLSDISFDIQKGSSVAFIGATGSGKSTMAELILGLFIADSGQILADGKDIRENLGAWRRSIGFVPQDIFLMDTSIKANIAFGLDDDQIDMAALDTAIKAANLDKFIESLPDGLETQVGERGTRLSGGQRQRIGIARALYRNPDVLVFDEATSALDNDTEAAVMAAIDSLRGSHTLIIVAHRLTTVRNCGTVFKFENGKVSEVTGTTTIDGTNGTTVTNGTTALQSLVP